MGTDIGDLLKKHSIEISDLSGKTIAVDGYNVLYQFLNVIKGRNGDYLKDSHGNITSHLSGIFYRFINLMEYNVKPIFVFDGEIPTFNFNEMNTENINWYSANIKWEQIKNSSKYQSNNSLKITTDIIESSKELLNLMGIPYVVAPSEGEAQAAHIVCNGDADYIVSQDYDSLLFGASNIIRNLTISGKKKIPKKNEYKIIKPEFISLEENLQEMDITQSQLIDIALCVGTDYNAGLAKIGAKKALKLVKKYNDIETILSNIDKNIDNFEIKKDYFLNPIVSNDYVLKWNELNKNGIITFLCNEHDFSIDKINNTINKYEKRF